MSKNKPKPKHRSKILILSYIAQFSLAQNIGAEDYGYAGLRSCRFQENCQPAIGSLVALQSAPASKWYFSWVVNIRPMSGGNEYLLESIEDGSLCRCRNVGILEFNPDTTKLHPEWRWTDRQHEFKDKWFRVFKKRNAHLYKPLMPIFGTAMHGVTLGIRRTFDTDEPPFRATRHFLNWHKVTQKDMFKFYDGTVEENS